MIRCRKCLYNFATKSLSHLTDPYTHQHVSDKNYISESQLFDKITKATSAHRQWKQRSLENRIQLTQKFVKGIIADQMSLRNIISSEIGKSFKDISWEFATINNLAGDFIQSSNSALKEVIIRNDHEKLEKYSFEPIGISLIFPYYSEPILDSLIHLIPCLISGGGALIKTSDYNHFLGGYLQRKAEQIIGLKGLVSDLFIHPETLPNVAQFRSIKKVVYSGSQSYARHVFQTMVKDRFIDCNLFFGGQDAAYVDATADLARAAKQICHFSFYNNGQSYDCIKRLFLHNTIHDQFLALLLEEVQKLVLGNPRDINTDLGPMCTQQEALNFESIITDSISEDAVCLIGGMITRDGQGAGLFCEPTVVKNCSSDMPIMQTQLAAPLVCVLEVASDQEFVQMVNENKYGTGIRIFTKEPKQYDKLIDYLQVGRIVFNEAYILNRNLPIEGWKKSGKGKILSSYSYQQYTLPKVFNITRTKSD